MRLCGLTLICLMLVTGAVNAEIQPFSAARLLEQEKMPVTHYRLVISELKRSQATTFGEQERRLDGDLWRRIWAVQPGLTLDEVSTFFQQQISELELIYQCQGLDCGSSHFWANTVFKNGRLVGREQNQRYWVVKRPLVDGGSEVWVLYLVQRGSRQVYIVMDRLVTADEVSLQQVSQTQIHAALRQNSGWLPGLVTDNGLLNEELSANLIAVLKDIPERDKRRLYLMMHCYDASLMADNLLCSERLAKQLRVATFNETSELNVVGHGALVAAPDSGLSPRLRYVFWPQR